jgi:hypothetical protein
MRLAKAFSTPHSMCFILTYVSNCHSRIEQGPKGELSVTLTPYVTIEQVRFFFKCACVCVRRCCACSRRVSDCGGSVAMALMLLPYVVRLLVLAD